MEKDLSGEVLDKIKNEKIKPKSRWHFMLQDYVVWLVFAISIVFGSLSFSIILHFWAINDWDAYYRINDNFFTFALLTMPYFWLAGFLLFLIVSYFYLKHTKTGYRYEFIKVVALNLALSFAFGVVLYGIGAGKSVENEFAKRSPFYNDLRTRQTYVWLNPERGVIIGKVVEIDDSGNIFELDDPHEMVWTVNATNAIYPQNFVMGQGVMIKVFGKRDGQNLFEAEEIRPLMRVKEPGIPPIPFFPGQ